MKCANREKLKIYMMGRKKIKSRSAKLGTKTKTDH